MFLVPVAEYFDRWDSPGISNDTEFTLLSLIFALCLVLIVSKLVSLLAFRMVLTLLQRLRQPQQSRPPQTYGAVEIVVPPLSPPLRI
jgi:hypothetical protein